MNMTLSPEQQKLKAAARELAESQFAEKAAEVDGTEAYPYDNVKALTEAGFMGYTVPKEYGGRGGSFFEATLIIEEMARVCGATGRITVEANMGAISAVMQYGTEQQKRMAAELVLAGDKPAICITEPNAGSAATEMTTRADKRGGTYVINGKKHWITGGGVSKLHLIFARIFDERGAEQGIGGFLAVAGTPGLKVGKREPAMGLRGIPETEVIFEDLEVKEDMLVLPLRGLRRGFADLIDAYNSQRVGAGTVALGIAQGAFERALAFVKEREQFGRPIAEFQGLQWMVADMAVAVNAARLSLHQAALSANPFPDPLLAAQAKIIASETANNVTNQALQLFGARGYSRNYPMERAVRDARMFTIAGGTAQVLRTLVASRVLGMKMPQTRDGYAHVERSPSRDAAE
jgi:alkylation response protein AidB-like acyl-CoA dehydrogenase